MKKVIYPLLFLLIIGCGDKDESKENTTSSIRITKKTSIQSPKTNQKFTRGESIPFQVNYEGSIDSIVVSVGDQKITQSNKDFSVSINSRRVGKWKLITKIYFEGQSETHHRTVIILQENRPVQKTYQVINTYPHDKEDFTQGLLVQDGFFYESTGQKGESSLKKKEIKTGKTLLSHDLSSRYFGEGLAFRNDQFYQITWTSGAGFIYNKNLEEVGNFTYSTDGWGLESYKDHLIMTYGKEVINFMNPETFSLEKTLGIYNHVGKVDSLNEMEIINDQLYANIWLSDVINVIDLETGEVTEEIDMKGLLTEAEAINTYGLNGIAYDQSNNRIFVTGKNWPKIFEVEFIPKPD